MSRSTDFNIPERRMLANIAWHRKNKHVAVQFARMGGKTRIMDKLKNDTKK